jgi:putative ABC transport system permease protein
MSEFPMTPLRILWSRFRGLFFKGSADSGLDAELRSHIDALTQENIRRGMSAMEAEHAARREFGGVTQTKQDYREQRSLPFLETLFQDIRFGFRLLIKDAALSAVIVAILAIGIGAGTSLYSLIDAWLVRAIRYTTPLIDRWEVVRAYLPQQKKYVNYLSVPEILEVAQLKDLFEEVGAVHGDSFTLSHGEYPERVLGTHVSASTLTMTRVAPFLGRTFTSEEDRPGGPRVVVLRYEFWKQTFSGDRNVLGQVMRLNDEDYTIIGVMPPHFELWGGRFWIPLQLNLADTNRSDRRNWIVAILRGNVSESQANARLLALSKQLEQEYSRTTPEYHDWTLGVWNIHEAVIGGVKPALLVLAGAVALLILAACANVAVLLLARSTSRLKEIALRFALGAARGRVIRQLLTESLLLSFAGAVVGIVLAMACLPVLVHLIPAEWSPTESDLVRVDHNAIAVSCAIAALMGILFGIAPALQVSQLDFVDSLKQGGAKASASRQSRLLRSGLISAEIALSLVVLAAAALMVRSYRNLEGIDLGFRSDHLLSFQISLPETKYPRGDQRLTFFSRALQELRVAPSIDGAAAVSGRPMADRSVDLTSRDFTIEGQPSEDARGVNDADFRVISPGYLETIGARVLEGRSFSERDAVGAPLAGIVNETMAKMFWPGGDAVGHRIRLGRQYARPDVFAAPENYDQPLTIVGIASDVRQIRDIDAPVRPEFYMPLAQQATPPRTMTLLLRSELDPATVTNSARVAVRSVDSEQPIYDISTMDEIVTDSFGPKRLTLFLLVFLAVVVMVLACIGLYATLSYSVGQRRRELGIRVAVGATGSDILRLVVLEGTYLAFAGVAFGLLAAFALTHLMQSLLYKVSGSDPATLFTTAAVLTIVAALASYVPARRASSVDPISVLRAE